MGMRVDNWTPLHVVAFYNTEPTVIDALMDRCTDIHAVDSGGLTARQLAQQRSGTLSNLPSDIAP